MQLLLGRGRWRLPLYAAALLTKISGAGLALAEQDMPSLAFTADRATEWIEENSSGNARFVAPYMLVAVGLTKDIPTLLVGRRPGIVSRRAGAEYFNTERIEANYPVIPSSRRSTQG